MSPQRRAPAVPAEELDIRRCLSFINTLSARSTQHPIEKLVSFEALLGWARDEGVLKPEEANRLSSRAKRRQAEADRVVAQARELRELLHDTLDATAARRTPAAPTLGDLSARLAGWYRHGRLAPAGESLQWIYAGGDDLERVLWEIARAASRLLTSPHLARVHACEAVDCGWWFMDESKNASRRWCDMKICGNREKLRRFRERSHRTS
jgi:predicted RNA-binding Zn ribbon-like protein